MTFDELNTEWAKDSNLDYSDIGLDALKISKLHHKYYTFFLKEKDRYFRMEAAHKKLRLDKYEFLTMGPTEETKDYDWRLPPQGKILKAEVQQYLDADKDITSSLLKLNMQKEKCQYLESIISSISFRNNTLRLAHDVQVFKNGGR